MAGVTTPAARTFSFLLPLWNSPVEFLDEQLRAIAGQSYPHWTCVIVDDASRDARGIELAERFARDDPRFRTVRRGENGGIAAATNDAIASSTGQWLVFCDHDDRVHEDALAVVSSAIDQHPDADLVYSDEQMIDTAGGVIETYRKPDLSPERLLGHNYFNHLVAVRRAFVDEIGGLDGTYEPCPDREFTLRASRSARRIVHVPQILYDWRSLPGSVALGVDEKPGVARAVTGAARAHLAALGTPAEVSSVPGDAAGARIAWPMPVPVPDVERVMLDEGTTVADIDAALRTLDAPYAVLLPRDAQWAGTDDLAALSAQCARPGVIGVGPRVVTDDGRLVSGGRSLIPFLHDVHQGGESNLTGRWGAFGVAREVAALHPIGVMLDRRAVLDLGGFDAAALAERAALGEIATAARGALAAPEGLDLTLAVLGLAADRAGRPLLWTPLAEVVVPASTLPLGADHDVMINAQQELARELPAIFEDHYSPLGVRPPTSPPAAEAPTAGQTPATRARQRLGAVGDDVKSAVVRRLDLDRIARRADVGADGVEGLRSVVHRLWQRVAELAQVVHRDHAPRLDAGDRWQQVQRGTVWASTAPLRTEPLISVIMPTRDRADLVAAAIASVQAQQYARWELIIVDDGSTDSTPSLLDGLADERIRRQRTEGIGAAAARNLGLQHASGDWVAFCDDDNAMHPAWLRGVAEFVGRHPETVAVYGAQLREDAPSPRETPWLLFEEPLDLRRLTRDNSIDLGVLATRGDHPELHFDEALGPLAMYDDWEMIVRIARHGPLVPLPVIASAYSLRGRGRLSERHDAVSLAGMRRRFADASSD